MEEMGGTGISWPPYSANSPMAQRLRSLIGIFVRGVTRFVEALVWNRSLILWFFLGSACLAVAGWIRPVLSSDISAIYLPLGAWARQSNATEILRGPHHVPVDSIGVILLVAIGVGSIVSLWRPRYFAVSAGVLLSLALCANITAALNHPGLVYLLDLELEARHQIDSVYYMDDRSPVTGVGNDRLNGEIAIWQPGGMLSSPPVDDFSPEVSSVMLPDVDSERGNWEHGFFYLLRGPYLIILGFLGFMFMRVGTFSRRLRDATAFAVLGILLASVVCFERLRGDYYWQRAKTLEARCDYEASRAAIESSCSACPAFRQRQTTWLLVGKLDEAEGVDSSARRYFRAYQAYRDKRYYGSVAHLEDLPAWPITQNPDTLEQRRALAAMDDVTASGDIPFQPAAEQAARFWTQRGLSGYLLPADFTDSGFSYLGRDQKLTAALDAFRRATELCPTSQTPLLCQGLVLIYVDRSNPQVAYDALTPLLAGLADGPLRADILNALGRSYVDAGQFSQGISLFSRSADSFGLPKIVNHGALRGLGGW
jgi:hypothetical protein